MAKDKSVEILSLRTFTLNSTKGHCVQIVAKVPTKIPRLLIPEAVAAGCILTDAKEGEDAFDGAEGGIKVGYAQDVRKSLLYIATRRIVEANDPDDFDGGGNPSVEALKAIVGFTVTKKEAQSIYRAYIEYGQQNLEYGLHEDAEKILTVTGASTKAELMELAVEYDIDVEALKGKSITDMRKFMLTKLSAIVAG